MIDHDRLFKELITTFFVEFLELFFPPVLAYLEQETLEFQRLHGCNRRREKLSGHYRQSAVSRSGILFSG